MTPPGAGPVLDLAELARREPGEDLRITGPCVLVSVAERDALVAALREYMNRCDCPGRTLWHERAGITDTGGDVNPPGYDEFKFQDDDGHESDPP